ncbi:HAD hydrolase family protein [Mammaliicoccus sciuri]
MNKKLIFFDIDGTIYDENKEIPESTIEAIKK